MLPIFVSFFTRPYADEADGLIDSLRAHGIEHDVRPRADAGNWTANCGQKAAFLVQMRAEHPGRPLVWVDADARIRKPPTLFDRLECDFAAHWRDGHELLSGTLYVGPTGRAADLLVAWQAACAAEPDEWDQRVLARLVCGDERLLTYALPATYTAIWDAGMCPVGEEVILHRQASRKLRHGRG